jgi:hypothetical protein
MSRRVKLNFKPLTLSETAKRLGIPRGRAERILTLIGLRAENRPTKRTRSRKGRSGKKSIHKAATAAVS